MKLKNATPYKIAVLSSLAITVFFTLFLGLLWAILHPPMSLLYLPVTSVLLYLICFFITIYTLKTYIYRKIKLIYKYIHKFKVESKVRQTEIDINKDIIGEVEQEVAQWAIQQNQEIEQLKALETYRRNFLGDISHELKTPLFNIQGYIHTLLEGGLYDADINESYLKRAASNVGRLQTIVEDLDAISRLESGEFVLEIQDFNIRKLAQEVFEDLRLKAGERQIELQFKEGASQPFTVRADRENIRQVLTNLIANSIKYGKIGGHTKVSFYDMENYILVEVADNGIGISRDDIKRVFDRFYRVDKSRSRDQGGSGLGLAIVKHIIEAHQQTITVRSTKGYGSTFGFTLEKAR